MQTQKFGIQNIQKVIVFLIAVFLFIAGVVKKKYNLISRILNGSALLAQLPDVYTSLKECSKEASEISDEEQFEISVTVAEAFGTSHEKAKLISQIVVKQLIALLDSANNIKEILATKEEDEPVATE